MGCKIAFPPRYRDFALTGGGGGDYGDDMDGSPPVRTVDGSRARTIRNPLMEEHILSELARGRTLAEICEELEISRAAIYKWCDGDDDFTERYAKARAIGWDAIADDCIRIADDKTIDPRARRVMVETRDRLLARWAAGTYANNLKIQAETTNRNLTLTANIDPIEAARQYQELVKD